MKDANFKRGRWGADGGARARGLSQPLNPPPPPSYPTPSARPPAPRACAPDAASHLSPRAAGACFPPPRSLNQLTAAAQDMALAIAPGAALENETTPIVIDMGGWQCGVQVMGGWQCGEGVGLSTPRPGVAWHLVAVINAVH